MAKRTQSSRPAGAARPPEMPGFIKPQLATLKSKAPVGSPVAARNQVRRLPGSGPHQQWQSRSVYTRNGLDWTKRFSQIAGALDIPGQAIIDGEVVVIHEGRTNFSRTAGRARRGQAGQTGLLRLRPSLA